MEERSQDREEAGSSKESTRIPPKEYSGDSKENLSVDADNIWPHLKKMVILGTDKRLHHYICYTIDELLKLTPETLPENKLVRVACCVYIKDYTLYLLLPGESENVPRIRATLLDKMPKPKERIEVFGKITFQMIENEYAPYIEVYFHRTMEDEYSDYIEMVNLLKEQMKSDEDNYIRESEDFVSAERLLHLHELITEAKASYGEDILTDLSAFIISVEENVSSKEKDFNQIKEEYFYEDMLEFANKTAENEFIRPIEEKLKDMKKRLEIKENFFSTLKHKILTQAEDVREILNILVGVEELLIQEQEYLLQEDEL